MVACIFLGVKLAYFFIFSLNSPIPQNSCFVGFALISVIFNIICIIASYTTLPRRFVFLRTILVMFTLKSKSNQTRYYAHTWTL